MSFVSNRFPDEYRLRGQSNGYLKESSRVYMVNVEKHSKHIATAALFFQVVCMFGGSVIEVRRRSHANVLVSFDERFSSA